MSELRGDVVRKSLVEPQGGLRLMKRRLEMSRRIDLPTALVEWIRIHVQSLGDPSRVRFRSCKRIPFWWLPGNRHMSGLTLWNQVFLRAEYYPIDPANRSTVELVFHELAHVLQFRKNPLRFPFRYFLHHFRYGYRDNPAEVEARRFADELVDQYFRDRDVARSRAGLTQMKDPA